MDAQHACYLFHRFEAAAHGTGTPTIEKALGPEQRFVVPEMGEGFLQFPGPCRGQFAGEQGVELLSDC